MSDAYRPRTTIDDSQFQGIINIYSTRRQVPHEKPLPAVGSAVGTEWGAFTEHIVIARGEIPDGTGRTKTLWIQHLPSPASLADQDAYNFSKTGSDTLSRFYVMFRSDYLDAAYAATLPTVGTAQTPSDPAAADPKFPLYKFATESVTKIGSDPNSILVAVERYYVLSPKVEKFQDDELEAEVTRTTEVVPRGTVSSSNAAGTTVEVVPQSEHHDLKVTSTLAGNYASARQLTTIPSDANYPFPPLLRGITIVAAWAWANSEEAAPAYDEASYFDFKRARPAGGPYEARRLRFLTTNPDALRLNYPIIKPVTVDESIGIARAWANASDRGNTAFAEARQVDVPETIHGEIRITNGDSISVGQNTNILPATPGFGEFVGSSSLIIGCEPSRTRFGLYLVEFIELNCTGVYNGVHVPFGTQISPGVELPDMGANLPDYNDTGVIKPSGTVSADNTTVSGITSPDAAVKAFAGDTEVGRGIANATGQYSFALDTVYTDATSLTLRAYLNGALSPASTITTNDLAPDRPTGYINSAMTLVRGTTEPGATVSVLRNAVAQVETCAIPANEKQKIKLTVIGAITGTGNAEAVVTWPGLAGGSETVTFAVTSGDNETAVATAMAAALNLNVDVSALLVATSTGPDLYLEVLTADDHESTASITLDNDTCTGLTPSASSIEVYGSSGLITVAGTAIAIITSALFDSPAQVPFWLAVGDDTTDMASAAAAALGLSVVNDDYIPASATSNATLTVRTIANDDATLNMRIVRGTCIGLPETAASSTNTTAGGTTATTTADADGNYAYTFPAALSAGTPVQVTASDDGGTSAPLLLEASASPPTLATATLATSDTITGTGSPNGATVRAYVAGVDVGDTTISAGAFTLTTDYKLVRGETVEVTAMTTGNEDVRSASIFLAASDLNLEIPVFELTDTGYVGVAPAGATQIRIREVAALPTIVEFTATIHPNGNFVFDLDGEAAGAAFDVYARYATGDSDMVRIFVPTIPKAEPQFRVWLGPVRDTWLPGSALDTTLGYTVDLPWCYKMVAFFQVWIDGMTVTVSFPGTDEDDIVITNCPGDVDIYNLATVASTPLTYPFGVPDKFARVYLNIPLVTSGPTPMPYDTVKVTLSYPDGDEVSAVFNASTFHDSFGRFINGSWNYQYFSPVYQKNKWEDYYAAGY